MDKVWIVQWSIYEDEMRQSNVEDKTAYRTYESAFAYVEQCVTDIPADVIERNEGWTYPLEGLSLRVIGLVGGDEWSYLIEELKVYP